MLILQLRRQAAGFLAVTAIVFLVPAAFAQQQSEEMQTVIAAEQLVQQQKPDEALAELQKVFEESEDFAPAYFVAGLAYDAKEDPAMAFENFLKASELNPGWGAAHRLASFHAAAMGNLEVSWEQAIKAHQSGTDMSDAFAGLPAEQAPDDVDMAMAALRVFVAPVDPTAFVEGGDRALQVGADGGNRPRQSQSASANTGRGQRIIQEAASDIALWERQARVQLSGSRVFGVVQRPDQAQYLMIFEIDEMSDSESRRRAEGYLKLVDSQSGEEAYRRRVEFSNIASFSDLNRDFSVIMGIMEEWATERIR